MTSRERNGSLLGSQRAKSTSWPRMIGSSEKGDESRWLDIDPNFAGEEEDNVDEPAEQVEEE